MARNKVFVAALFAALIALPVAAEPAPAPAPATLSEAGERSPALPPILNARERAMRSAR
jgi:hypothetical protein